MTRLRLRASQAATVGDGVVVRESTLGAEAGRGLYATRTFFRGDWITEYCGERIDFAEARRRHDLGRATHIRSVVPLHTAIDGFRQPTKARGLGGASFANDGRSSALNNAVFCKVELDGGRVFLRARHTIARGSEIFVNYGQGYWRPKPHSVSKSLSHK